MDALYERLQDSPSTHHGSLVITVTALLSDVTFGVLVLLIFLFLRRHNRLLYYPRKYLLGQETSFVFKSGGLTTRIRKTLDMDNNPKLLMHMGIDAFTLLRFTKLCLRFFVFASLISTCIVIVPCLIQYQHQSPDSEKEEALALIDRQRKYRPNTPISAGNGTAPAGAAQNELELKAALLLVASRRFDEILGSSSAGIWEAWSATIILSVVLLLLLYKEQQHMHRFRELHLLKSRKNVLTLLMTCLPQHTNLHNLLVNRLLDFYPKKVDRVDVVYDKRIVRREVEEYFQCWTELEEAIDNLQITGERPTQSVFVRTSKNRQAVATSTQTSVSSSYSLKSSTSPSSPPVYSSSFYSPIATAFKSMCCCCCGKVVEVDIIDRLMAKRRALPTQIYAALDVVEANREHKGAAFVTFANPESAQFTKTQLSLFEGMQAALAPTSKHEIIWDNLQLTKQERWCRKIMANIAMTLLIIFWIIPAALAAGLARSVSLTVQRAFARHHRLPGDPFFDDLSQAHYHYPSSAQNQSSSSAVVVGQDDEGITLGSRLMIVTGHALSGLICASLIQLFLSLVPPLLRWIARYEGLWTYTMIELNVIRKMYILVLITGFIGEVPLLLLLSPHLEEYLTQPLLLLQLLANFIPAQAGLFASFILYTTFVTFSWNLLRLGTMMQGLCHYWHSHISLMGRGRKSAKKSGWLCISSSGNNSTQRTNAQEAEEEDDEDEEGDDDDDMESGGPRVRSYNTAPISRWKKVETFYPPENDFPSHLSSHLLVFVFALTFSIIAPILLPCALMHFLIAYFFHLHHGIHVNIDRSTSDGKLWKILFDRMIFSLVVFQTLMAGWLRAKGGEEAFWAMLPVIVLTVLFWTSLKNKMDRRSTEQDAQIAKSISRLNPENRPEDYYVQYSRSEEIGNWSYKTQHLRQAIATAPPGSGVHVDRAEDFAIKSLVIRDFDEPDKNSRSAASPPRKTVTAPTGDSRDNVGRNSQASPSTVVDSSLAPQAQSSKAVEQGPPPSYSSLRPNPGASSRSSFSSANSAPIANSPSRHNNQDQTTGGDKDVAMRRLSTGGQSIMGSASPLSSASFRSGSGTNLGFGSGTNPGRAEFGPPSAPKPSPLRSLSIWRTFREVEEVKNPLAEPLLPYK